MKRYLCISSEQCVLLESKWPILQKMSTGVLSAVLKLVPGSQCRFAVLFTVFTINLLPVYYLLLYKAPDFWNANEVRGCLPALLFLWLNEQRAAHAAVVVIERSELHTSVCFRFQSIHQLQRTFINMVNKSNLRQGKSHRQQLVRM